jgi:hypothetical protein
VSPRLLLWGNAGLGMQEPRPGNLDRNLDRGQTGRTQKKQQQLQRPMTIYQGPKVSRKVCVLHSQFQGIRFYAGQRCKCKSPFAGCRKSMRRSIRCQSGAAQATFPGCRQGCRQGGVAGRTRRRSPDQRKRRMTTLKGTEVSSCIWPRSTSR